MGLQRDHKEKEERDYCKKCEREEFQHQQEEEAYCDHKEY